MQGNTVDSFTLVQLFGLVIAGALTLVCILSCLYDCFFKNKMKQTAKATTSASPAASPPQGGRIQNVEEVVNPNGSRTITVTKINPDGSKSVTISRVADEQPAAGHDTAQKRRVQIRSPSDDEDNV